jgi:hypothetical protein
MADTRTGSAANVAFVSSNVRGSVLPRMLDQALVIRVVLEEERTHEASNPISAGEVSIDEFASCAVIVSIADSIAF